jgi:hypothetical protein
MPWSEFHLMLAVIKHSDNVLEKCVSKDSGVDAQSHCRVGNTTIALTPQFTRALFKGDFVSKRKHARSLT